MTDPAPTPSPLSPDDGHPRKWWILVAVSIGMFMGLLDVTIVNIAIPSIEADLRASLASISWVLNAYSLTLAVFFLTMGRIGDKFGRKRVFLFGLVTFTAFSFLCGIAPDIRWLVAFRAGQGVGGAALLTVSLAIVLGAFPRRQQGAAVGIWAALGTAAAAVGPVLGGVLLTYGQWSWIFFVNVPVGIFALVACGMVIPRDAKSVGQEGGLDIPGMLISGAGLFMLTLALVQGGDWGWTSPVILGLFAGAVISFPLFIWREVSTPSPMFPVTLLRIRSFTAANSAVTAAGHEHGRHVPPHRHLPAGGPRLHAAARRCRHVGDPAGLPADRPQLGAPQRPHRATPPRRRRRGVLRLRPDPARTAERRGHPVGCGLAGAVHRRRHGPRHADPVRRLHGVPATAGARCRLGLAQHHAPGGLHHRSRPAGGHLLAHHRAERAAGDETGRRRHRRQPAAEPRAEAGLCRGRDRQREAGGREQRAART